MKAFRLSLINKGWCLTCLQSQSKPNGGRISILNKNLKFKINSRRKYLCRPPPHGVPSTYSYRHQPRLCSPGPDSVDWFVRGRVQGQHRHRRRQFHQNRQQQCSKNCNRHTSMKNTITLTILEHRKKRRYFTSMARMDWRRKGVGRWWQAWKSLLNRQKTATKEEGRR